MLSVYNPPDTDTTVNTSKANLEPHNSGWEGSAIRACVTASAAASCTRYEWSTVADPNGSSTALFTPSSPVKCFRIPMPQELAGDSAMPMWVTYVDLPKC